jgi:hypothetical protein
VNGTAHVLVRPLIGTQARCWTLRLGRSTHCPKTSKGADAAHPSRPAFHRVSKASGAAFTKSVDLAKANHAELVLLHVLAPLVPMMGEGCVPPKVYQDLYASAHAYGEGA